MPAVEPITIAPLVPPLIVTLATPTAGLPIVTAFTPLAALGLVAAIFTVYPPAVVPFAAALPICIV